MRGARCKEDGLTGLNLAAVEGGSVLTLDGSDLTLTFVILVVALLALVVAYALVREVLNAGQGTERMQNIARAVQEGAAAYLKRQFRTLIVFAVGNNRFMGQADFRDPFRDHVNLTLSKSVFFGLRNTGSISRSCP
jgi:hypothetical protein